MSCSNSLRRLFWEVRYGRLERMGSDIRRHAAIVTHLHANIAFEGPVRIGPGFGLRIPDHGTLRVGTGVDLRRNFVCEISGEGKVTIGDGCVFAGSMTIQCSTSIEFAENVMMGTGCLIADGNHRFRDYKTPIRDQGYDFRPIKIGRGALALANVVIVNDIGEGSVIGANSVVAHPIPPFCLAVGAPARVIEYFGPPDLRPAELDESDQTTSQV